ncbi:MAG TPA: hypothetical protein VNJ05_05875 [Sphingomicrobium sp.]|nr:hypothetical protein [Sphingomicrobium sp.]
MGYFFEGGPDDAMLAEAETASGAAAPRHRETAELVRAYFALQDRILRQRILDLIRALGASVEREDAAVASDQTRRAGVSGRRVSPR